MRLPTPSVQLHHTNGNKPDWAVVAPGKRNIWQKLASDTHGVATPGNFVSVAGFMLVLIGLYALHRGQLIAALWYIAAGRFCDVLDGLAADRTGTKSPLGAGIDATLDKFGMLGILLLVGFKGVAPWLVVELILLQNAINSLIGLRGWRRKVGLQPVAAGKISAALEWFSLACFLIAAAYQHVWLWPAYILLVPALVLGGVSAVAYGKALLAHAK